MSEGGGTTDDRRTASGLVTALSSYVITAALAVLGAQAVLATFVVDRRQHLTAFYVVGACGTTALVLSILVGGSGIYEIISAGALGDWKIRTRRRKFNAQVWLALIGTILVIASAFLGDTKPSSDAPQERVSIAREAQPLKLRRLKLPETVAVATRVRLEPGAHSGHRQRGEERVDFDVVMRLNHEPVV